ncbi:DNA repair protein XRCC2 [Phymastichus coffea]|uniref:DNA repair protein XRCC2 n=1 Tax=Phymastichus coffea TaxID=108790 RepID=UPI00273B7D6D|nr:DNA repair protein XRCC2 [Phymastichus coffea]
MSSDLIIESGLQVVTRLIDRPSVEDLDNDLFFNKLRNTDVVELRGTVSSRLNLLLTKLIVKCILPLQYNGFSIDVLLINTENQFRVSHLVNILKDEISAIQGPINVDSIVEKLLNNLKIINCYNYYQFFVTINSLDNILLKNKKVGMIVLDSISAYYWLQKDELSYNSYVMKMLNIIRKITIEFKVVTLYTKQYNFESKRETVEWHEGKKYLRYLISLSRNEDSNELICNIQSGKDKKQLYYKINGSNIVWVEKASKKIIVC